MTIFSVFLCVAMVVTVYSYSFNRSFNGTRIEQNLLSCTVIAREDYLKLTNPTVTYLLLLYRQ
jgi:hypothetical protein